MQDWWSWKWLTWKLSPWCFALHLQKTKDAFTSAKKKNTEKTEWDLGAHMMLHRGCRISSSRGAHVIHLQLCTFQLVGHKSHHHHFARWHFKKWYAVCKCGRLTSGVCSRAPPSVSRFILKCCTELIAYTDLSLKSLIYSLQGSANSLI